MFSQESLSVDTFPTFTTFKLNNISTILFYTRYRKIPPIFSGRWNTLSNITWSTRNTMNIFNLFDFSHEILQSLFAFYESTNLFLRFSLFALITQLQNAKILREWKAPKKIVVFLSRTLALLLYFELFLCVVWRIAFEISHVFLFSSTCTGYKLRAKASIQN